LIKQAEYLKEHQEKEKRLEEFLYELAYGKKEYNQNFYYLAKEYGIDLKQNYQGVLLQVQKKENFEEKLKKMLPKSTHFLRLDAHRIILFLRESKENALLFQVLQAKKEVQKIGIGDFSKPFSISIERAAQAIEIGKKIKPNQKIYSYEEWEFFIGLTHSDKTKRIQWIERLEKVGEKLELVRTLQTYIEENGEMNETAKKLNIHRNTLNYRLEKIYKLTGKHPKNLLNLLELLASILWK
jgi:carbohydrate diacid regulator